MPGRKRRSILNNIEDSKKSKRNSLAPADAVKSAGIARPRSPSFRLPPLFKPLEEREFGILLSMGQNDVGQLGLGEDVEQRKKPAPVENLDDIVAIACGGMHTLCLHKSGEVTTFGCNDANALGRDGSEHEPTKINLPGKAIQISAGDSHSAALLEDGKVFAWGTFRDNSGEIGLTYQGKDGVKEKLPVQILPEKEVSKISSGDDHLVLLTVDGNVYTCGNPESGQLGRLSKRHATRDSRQGVQVLLTPGQVDIHPARRSSTKVRCNDIWTGSYCTFAKDANSGAIYVFGLSNYKQIGLDIEEPQYYPVVSNVFDSKTWKQIASGMHHTLALDDEGKVYSLGRPDYGQLGLGPDSEVVGTPTLIPALEAETCVHICCGSTVSFAITKEGKLFSWGFGENYQLGTGHDEDVQTPVEVKGPKLEDHLVMLADAGGQHTVIIAKKNK